MRDVDEGLSALGTIVTGARRERVPVAFAPIVAAARTRFRELRTGSLYLYGSVATGAARAPTSDVDMLTIDVPRLAADAIGRELSATFAGACRAVEIGAAELGDYLGDDDEAYGNRVFLRHYCVHLEGPNGQASLPNFAGDARAARGFNGDIALHTDRWAAELSRGADASVLGRRLARKTLLAVAGLVSIHDNCWTTDRVTAARRWSTLDPLNADALATLLRWADGEVVPTSGAVREAIDGIVAIIVDSFASTIGLWS
jgi:uncharacterized protein